MNNKSQARQKIRYRIRKKVNGTASTPRLTVFRSNTDMYAQMIDDETGTTIAGASSRQKDISAQKAPKTEKAKWLVRLLREKRLSLELKKWFLIVAGIFIHGRIKAVAEGAREGGLKF